MRKVILTLSTLIGLLYGYISNADTLASCSNPEGHAYYHYQAMMPEKNSGWVKDKISGGIIQLQKTDIGYDIYYIDVHKKMKSMVQDDGAKVFLLEIGENDVSFLAKYTGGTEIFRFFKETNGKNKFSTVALKAFVPKSSLMVGECSSINFQNIK